MAIPKHPCIEAQGFDHRRIGAYNWVQLHFELGHNYLGPPSRVSKGPSLNQQSGHTEGDRCICSHVEHEWDLVLPEAGVAKGFRGSQGRNYVRM